MALNSFLFVILFLLKFLFKTEDNSFVIDKYLFNKYLIDYILSLFILCLIGVVVSMVIMQKKYFKYKYEGLRAVRAFELMMFYICIIVYTFPYFWLF